MKRTTILMLAVLALSACKDNFLDRSSLTQLAEGNFWKTAADARLGINGIFDVLQDPSVFNSSLGGAAGITSYDNMTDNSYNKYRFQGQTEFVEGNVTPATLAFDQFWEANYKGIVRSNQALVNIEKMSLEEISDIEKKNLLGQSRFLRALFYFNIALYFEDAPLILEPQTLAEAFVPKSSQQDILAAIISDLQFASENLPLNQSPALFGYATKGAAFGLMARVQLFNKNWEEAAKAADEVIKLKQYDLTTPYYSLFTEAGELSKDVIFSVRYQEASGFATGETFGSTYLVIPRVMEQPMPNMVMDYYCTDGKPISSSPLYKAATPKLNRDPRLLASVYFKNDVFITDKNTVFAGNSDTGYGKKKYTHNKTTPQGTNPTGAQSQDFYVIRYADVLLMKAEALIESDETGPDVYSLINEVRARVNMPTVQAAEGTSLGQEKLRDIVRHERRVELAFEGLRFYDLKRWGKFQEAYSRMVADKVTGYLPNYRNRRSESFPIPLGELDANKKLDQNEVWK